MQRAGPWAGSLAYRRPMRKTLAVLVILLSAAACGGGGNASSTSDTIAPKVRDQLASDIAVLQAPDLPGGVFVAAGSTDVESTARDKVSQEADDCFITAVNDKTATAVREFVNGKELQHIIVRGEIEAHTSASGLTGTP